MTWPICLHIWVSFSGLFEIFHLLPIVNLYPIWFLLGFFSLHQHSGIRIKLAQSYMFWDENNGLVDAN